MSDFHPRLRSSVLGSYSMKQREIAYMAFVFDHPRMQYPRFRRKVADYVREHDCGDGFDSDWVSTQEAYKAVLEQECNKHEHTGRCDDAK